MDLTEVITVLSLLTLLITQGLNYLVKVREIEVQEKKDKREARRRMLFDAQKKLSELLMLLDINFGTHGKILGGSLDDSSKRALSILYSVDDKELHSIADKVFKEEEITAYMVIDAIKRVGVLINKAD